MGVPENYIFKQKDRSTTKLIKKEKKKHEEVEKRRRYLEMVYTGFVPEDYICSSRLQDQVIFLHQIHNFYQEFNIIMLFSK